MKRFEFSLNKLMGYKQQVLDREKNNLAHLRRQQQQYMDEKRALEEKLRNSNREFCLKSAQGMTIMQVNVFKGYHHTDNGNQSPKTALGGHRGDQGGFLAGKAGGQAA